MADFTATKVVTIHNTVEAAVAALETALEATVNTAIIRTCDVVRIEANKYAAILVWTAAA
jgi:uncharacterized protein